MNSIKKLALVFAASTALTSCATLSNRTEPAAPKYDSISNQKLVENEKPLVIVNTDFYELFPVRKDVEDLTYNFISFSAAATGITSNLAAVSDRKALELLAEKGENPKEIAKEYKDIIDSRYKEFGRDAYRIIRNSRGPINPGDLEMLSTILKSSVDLSIGLTLKDLNIDDDKKSSQQIIEDINHSIADRYVESAKYVYSALKDDHLFDNYGKVVKYDFVNDASNFIFRALEKSNSSVTALDVTGKKSEVEMMDEIIATVEKAHINAAKANTKFLEKRSLPIKITTAKFSI